MLPLIPRVYWLTGLSGAGKSTVAESSVAILREMGQGVIHLDGDILRQSLCADLGFTEEERTENIRRAASLAHIAQSQGILTVCSLITPLRSQRDLARKVVGEAFREVFIDCPLEECVRRDPKGLYCRAIAGEIPHFTGISAPYEIPDAPDLHIPTGNLGPTECVRRLVAYMERG